MKSSNNAGYLVALTLFLAFGLLVLWEFWLEELILVHYLEIEVHKNSLDRWTFIVSCLSIVCLSLVLPLKSMKSTSDEMKSLKTALHGEQALSKEFFSVDNSIILVINNSNKIMQINKKTSFLLGFKEDEMLGQDWISLLIQEKNQAGLSNQYKQFVKDKNQNFIRFTAIANTKDGTEKMIDWQCAPLRDEHGKIYGSINSGQDISEQIRLREELSHLKGKFEPLVKKLTSELNFNKKKYHGEAIKSASARSRFKFWFELERTLISLSPEQLKNPEDIKNRIQKALKLFGEISNTDQGYVFKFTPSGTHTINTHLWVSGEPLMEPDQDEEISLDNFPWLKKTIQQKKTVHIPTLDKIPEEASSEKETYLSQGIKSFINVPIIHNDSAVGYVGFESNEKEKEWDNDEINIIQVMARLISHATHPSSSPELQVGEEVALSLGETENIQPEMDLPQLSFEKTSKKERVSKAPAQETIPPQETAPPVDKELRKVRESFEKEFQEKLKSMERAQSQLMSELKERKEIEADLRANRDSIERQLEEKSLELEKLLTKAGQGNKGKPTMKTDSGQLSLESQPKPQSPTKANELEEIRNVLQKKETELATLRSQLKSKSSSGKPVNTDEFKAKIIEKDNEIKSLQKSFEEEKSAKAQLEKNLSSVQEFIDKHKKDIEVLETANQVMGAELEELRKVQEEFFTHSIQLEDTQQELESLEIANEQLMTDVEEKKFLIEEAKEKAAHYEQMDLPLFTLNQDGTILSWNNTAAAATGYIRELTLDESISILFAPKDDFDFETDFLIPIREKSKHHIEVPIKKLDGTLFNALIKLVSFKDRNGTLSTLGYLINLSESENEDEISTIKRQFTALLGNSGLIVVTLSPDYLISDMNEKAASTFQWDREDALGKNLLAMTLSQENWQEISSDIQERMNTQASADMETKIEKDGTEHVFLWNLVKEIDPKDESVKGIIAIAQDVTDMRSTQNNLNHAQKELTENQLLLSLLVDKAEDGLISIDENGIIQSFNTGAEKLFGFTSHEIIGQNVSQLMPDPYSKEHDNYIRKYLDTGNSNFIGGPSKELLGKNKDGSTFPIEITLKEIYKDYQRLFIGIVRDIRKRKEAEIHLAENEGKYRRFMEAESDAILVVDAKTKQILEYNHAAPQLYGYEAEEFLTLNFRDLLTGNDPSPNNNNPSPITEMGSTHKIPQIDLMKKDGAIFPASITSSSFHFKDREYELKIIRDLSVEVLLEKQLEENKNSLEEALQQNEKQKMSLREEKLDLVDQITSSMVDLVNNPIQGIENILEQVKERAEMEDIHKGLVTVAMNECRRVADLISRMKSFQPPTKENLESLDVHQVLDEAIQNNMDTINDRTITLEKNYANGLPAIDAVTPQIRQAINNIVKNAEESLSEDDGKIIISTEQDGENVKIHIADTGCGITDANMDRIFDPFFTTKSAIHRPGLGLLASLGIVKNHHGEINVHSKPGTGTTFTLTLPLKQPVNQNGES